MKWHPWRQNPLWRQLQSQPSLTPALPANDLAIAIPEDRKVIGVTVDGPHWLLLLDGRGSQQIWIVNKADGVVLRKVQLVEVDD